MITKVDPETYLNTIKNLDRVKDSKFIGYTDLSDCDCYLVYNEAGFAITRDRELVSVFNGSKLDSKYFRLLADPEVIDFIKDAADWLVCVGYVAPDSTKKDLSEYYHGTLGFNVFGYTENDIEDMTQTRGKEFTEEFVKEFGTPYQVFMLNPRFMNVVNPGFYGSNGYKAAKKNISMWIDFQRMGAEHPFD